MLEVKNPTMTLITYRGLYFKSQYERIQKLARSTVAPNPAEQPFNVSAIA